MAYRPWTTASFHVEFLIKGDEKDFKSVWSYPEIIHAGSILATYHSFCSLVLGMGLKEDTDIAMYFPKYLSECQEGGNKSLDVHTDSEVSDSQYMSEIEKNTFKYFKNSENEDKNISDGGVFGEEDGGSVSESNTLYK
jgi:hypothetical protein